MERAKSKEIMEISEKRSDEIEKWVTRIVRITECCTMKFHVSEFLSENCVKRKRS
jgi:hypothetical protein